ncbi:ArsR/SmtB family transcription factor [Picrophilus oshimae]|uniref:Transcriptional regulator, ArsR family n=1 Tax=Picrophilus torridus (strain ATCC 700027 / DSM 9790 / JCM 10055 / NBRC 100828 / KAW 2/3) TaxID=1122961 RepID=A0A8G2FWC0_PICTO|nr:winged helix-turn-helix domain-containing protein [Picrophilus oshimae]SMD30656.1 transcriptional regulator, ArsR family [Picrophilus oshimae DSM 9789]
MDLNDDNSRLIWWLLVGTRGGKTRSRIITLIKDEPKNIHQLSLEMNVNYRTIEHHIKIMLDNKIITFIGDGYGRSYVLSNYYRSNYSMIDEILRNYYNFDK